MTDLLPRASQALLMAADAAFGLLAWRCSHSRGAIRCSADIASTTRARIDSVI